MRIAFAGNPNSGKTTMYNALTGRNEKVDTTSTSGEGLAEVVKAAAALNGQGQKAPYNQGSVDLTNKEAVIAADKKRFEFVNAIVASVETRKVLTKDKNFQDKIDAVLTHPIAGIPIFAAIMFLVFHISQSDGSLGLGVWLADTLVGWLEAFQATVGELVSGASPILQALLVDGIIGGVAAVVGFPPGLIVVAAIVAVTAYLINKTNKSLAAEYALKK